MSLLKKEFLNYLGQCFEGGFIVDDDNRQQLRKIFDTFENCKEGIIISGKTGTGKSIIFEALHRILNPKDSKRFKIEQAQDIVHDYNQIGSDVFKLFEQPKNFVIDDIGIENIGRFYGKDCNVIEDLIGIRYNVFKNTGAKTHYTTNLSVDQLKQKYGDRSASRLGEMCNLVVMSSNDRRSYRNFKQWVKVSHSPVFSDEDKAWQERYKAYRDSRMNMTKEQIEAEHNTSRREFMLGNNPEFVKFKEQFFSNQEPEA